MLISDKYRFIFIHTYKTAGTSITNALLPFSNVQTLQHRIYKTLKERFGIRIFKPTSYPSHIHASELLKRLGRDRFKSYFSFAFVRNPWDWQVSLYSYMKKTPDHYQHELVKEFANFDEYIQWRCAKSISLNND